MLLGKPVALGQTWQSGLGVGALTYIWGEHSPPFVGGCGNTHLQCITYLVPYTDLGSWRYVSRWYVTFNVALVLLCGETSLSLSIIFVFSGLIYGPLLEKFGFRKVCITSSILAATGYVASSFVHDVRWLYLTHGLMGGRTQHTLYVNTCSLGQNGRHPADDIFKRIFMNETFFILIRISLKFVLKDPIDYKSGLAHVMAWRRTGDKPLPEPMLTHFPGAYMRY